MLWTPKDLGYLEQPLSCDNIRHRDIQLLGATYFLVKFGSISSHRMCFYLSLLSLQNSRGEEEMESEGKLLRMSK